MDLTILNGDGKGKRFKVEEQVPCFIGRDLVCTICLNDKLVSKKHAVVSLADGKLTITDLAAANGTFVNGVKVSSKLLALHDNITIGACVFRVSAMNDAEGDSIVSLTPDKQVIHAQVSVPAKIMPGGKVSSVAECVHGMQSIILRHSNDMVRESLKYIFRMLPVTRIAVFNVQEDGGIAQGYTVCRRVDENPTTMSRSFALRVLQAGKALLIRDTEELDSRTLDASIGFKGVHCIIGLPIVIQGRVMAILLGDNLEEPDSLTDDHLRMMQFAGKAIEVLYQRDAVGKLEDMVNHLPVCDWCKRIRDDQGYWTQLDAFVAERVPVRFAKSCCPECAGKVIGS